MSSALYIFRLFWPFLKELVLGGVTLKEGMRTQKKRVFLLFFVSSLIFTIFLIIPRFYQLAQEHNKLEKSVEATNLRRLEDRIKELEKFNQKPHPPAPSISAASSPDKPKDEPSPTPPLPPPPIKPKDPVPKAPERTPEVLKPPDDFSERKKSYMDFFDEFED